MTDSVERDREIQEIIEEETARGDSESQIRPLRIVEQVGGEPRWESDRFDEWEPRKEDVWADGLLAWMESRPRKVPIRCAYPASWEGGWDYGKYHNEPRIAE